MPEPQLPDLQAVSSRIPYTPSDPIFKSDEPHSQQSTSSPVEDQPRYTIRRKGSRYNIFGPHGRIFRTYKSASVTGPRWEELTRTPWPYPSTAYEPGARLRQLGLAREEPHCRPDLPLPPRPLPLRPARLLAPGPTAPVLLALPAPRIDVARQDRLIRELKRNPRRVLQPEMQQALHNEIDYHRPHAAWAQKVLDLLARHRARKLAEPPLPNILDVYRNPLLALHPDQEGVRAMLRDEARASGLLGEFALKLEGMLVQWQSDPERLRAHLRRQAEIIRQGGTAPFAITD